MDTTLRYVQQFGRSKRDNLKPSLTSKYHVGQTIEVYPFRIMDFGCFASTADGLSGLLHNSEMTSVMQASLPELIEKAASLSVRIAKYDRRSGEVAFNLEKKAAVQDDAAATDAPQETPLETLEETAATATEAATAPPAAKTEEDDLVPFQFTTSQPVYPAPETRTPAQEAAYSEFLDNEMVDIQKFLETVIKSELSPAARKMLKELLTKTSIFRFTYTMQTVVDEFEPDVGLQLVSLIERTLEKQQPKSTK